MQNEIINGSGWLFTTLSVGFNMFNWLAEVNLNQLATVIISLLSIVFLSMKIYDQFLITRDRKRTELNNKKIKL